MIGHTDLVADFKKLGLKNGDTVLVHSSLKSLGYVEGGAECVIGSILDTVGEKGTLVVPVLTGKREDSPGQPPVFDVRSTPCWTGRIPETVRRMPEARRSLHPTHSVAAIGYEARYLTADHENSSSPCDKQSPYWKLAQMGGHIMLIGVDQESNTTVHCCEEIAGVPYHLQNKITECRITGYDGGQLLVKNRLHNWEKPETDFNKLDGLYIENGIMIVGKVGEAAVRLIDAGLMLDFTVELLKKDPSFLII